MKDFCKYFSEDKPRYTLEEIEVKRKNVINMIERKVDKRITVANIISVMTGDFLLEIVQKIENNILPLSNDWSDIPMQQIERFKFNINIPLMEIGNFEAKVYVRLGDGSIKSPEGSNTRIKVEPIITFAGNTIYTAFTRLFGEASEGRAVC